MKVIGYFIIVLVTITGFSSCALHKAGDTSAHYKNRPYDKYFIYSAGYGHVHSRPPID